MSAEKKRVIIHCEMHLLKYAGEAAQWLFANPQHKETIYSLSKDGKPMGMAFFAKRNRSSISVRQVKP